MMDKHAQGLWTTGYSPKPTAWHLCEFDMLRCVNRLMAYHSPATSVKLIAAATNTWKDTKQQEHHIQQLLATVIAVGTCVTLAMANSCMLAHGRRQVWCCCEAAAKCASCVNANRKNKTC